MTAKVMLGLLVAGAILLVAVAASWPEPVYPPAPEVAHLPPKPVLSRDAADQIIGGGGTLGPLFAGIRIGDPMPAREVRARIAQFARDNHAEIELESDGDRLTAVKFGVTFGGCCGYEDADALGAHLGRPHTGDSCLGIPDRWVNHWTSITDDGVHVRIRINVNRVEVRWEHPLALADVLLRANDLLGTRAAVAEVAFGREWIEVERDHKYVLAMPFAFSLDRPSEVGAGNRDDLGIHVVVEDGRITELSFWTGRFEGDGDTVELALRALWGRPRKTEDGLTWRRADRTITAEHEGPSRRVTIRTPDR